MAAARSAGGDDKYPVCHILVARPLSGPHVVRHGLFEQDTLRHRKRVDRGLFSTFFHGSAHFNSALWTMHYELFGSFAAYATALVLIFQKSFARAMATGALVAGADHGDFDRRRRHLLCHAGRRRAGRADLHGTRKPRRRALAFLHPWRVPIVLATAGLAIVLCGYDGYSKPVGFYAFMAPFASPPDRAAPARHRCDRHPRSWFCFAIRYAKAGRASRGLLGRLSFPVYLVHLPILLGLVSPDPLRHGARFGTIVAAPAAFALFVMLTLAAAYPLAHLDEWWVRKLREMTSLVVTSVRAA